MYSIINRYFTYKTWNLMLVLFIITGIFTGIIFYFLWPKYKLKYEKLINGDDNSNKTSIIYKVIDVLLLFIIAPYIETLIFQYAIFRLIEMIYRGNSRFLSTAFMVSALVLTVVHGLPDKDWKSAIMRLPLSLALSCIFSLSIINNLNPIVNTTIFHAIWNTTTFTLLTMSANLIGYFKKKGKSNGNDG